MVLVHSEEQSTRVRNRRAPVGQALVQVVQRMHSGLVWVRVGSTAMGQTAAHVPQWMQVASDHFS